jgi:DNA relaxase NicK
MRGLLLWLSATGGKATRLDLAIDDYGRGVLPADVRASIMRGEVVTRAKGASFRETLRGSSGHTVYIGSRASRVMLRMYDKLIESRGQVTSVRWELVLREEAAQAVQQELATKAWALLFNSQLVRFVDFREPNSGSRTNRQERMTWFAEIVEDATKAPPYMPHPVYSADKAMQHFRRNQAPMLAALIASEGGSVDFIYDATRNARKRWRRKHEIIAADQISDAHEHER